MIYPTWYVILMMALFALAIGVLCVAVFICVLRAMEKRRKDVRETYRRYHGDS